MSTNTTTRSSGGVGLTGLLFITFLVLKLTGVITWSWWWVTAPLWGGVVLVLCFVALAFVLSLIVSASESRSRARSRAAVAARLREAQQRRLR